MRVEDLNIGELVEFDSEDGVVRFAGQRALIIDATAKGNLRKELINHFGLSAARAVLTRFGFVQGWRMAEAMQDLFQWESEDDWHHACGRIHMLEGMYRLGPGTPGSLTKEGLTLVGSYEAEQHIAHLGRSDTSVCWTICGLTSGYLSRALGKEIYVLEERCIGRGDAVCHLLGRTLEEWGDDRADRAPLLPRREPQGMARALAPPDHREPQGGREEAPREEARAHPGGPRGRGSARDDRPELPPCGVSSTSPGGSRRWTPPSSSRARAGRARSSSRSWFTMSPPAQRVRSSPSTAVRSPSRSSRANSSATRAVRSQGAAQDRVGLFEAANGGTLLLDEIGDVSPGMQVKLLRVLQEREIRRVGENKSRPVNVRVMAATNRELAADIAAGRFRKDLYYRLNVVQLHVPPLRDRREDILPLARVLLADAAARFNRPVTGLSPRAADQLLRYDWPGNVRELENAMERAVALGRANLIELDELPEEVRQAIPIPSVSGPVRALDEIEKDYILAVLDLNGGNQTRTAEQLGIGSATLYRKLKSFGVVRGTRTARGADPALLRST